MSMGMNREHQPQDKPPSGRRTSRRQALFWGTLAAIGTVLTALGLGLGAEGPWYMVLGSLILGWLSGSCVNRVERSLSSSVSGVPRALAGLVLGVVLMIMFHRADNHLLFTTACVGTLFGMLLAVIAIISARRTSTGVAGSVMARQGLVR